MALPLIVGAVAPIIDKLIGHFWPDATDEEKAKLEAFKAAMALDLAQHEVNKTEAAHPSLFVAGWRPFVGWTAGAGMAWSFIGQPLLAWASGIWGFPVPPTLDLTQLITVLVTMLGMSSLRTYEGLQGIKRSAWKNPDL